MKEVVTDPTWISKQYSEQRCVYGYSQEQQDMVCDDKYVVYNMLDKCFKALERLEAQLGVVHHC